MSFAYYNNCVNWDAHDVNAEGGLCDMVSSGREITRRTFIRHVGLPLLREFEREMGYPCGELTTVSGKAHGMSDNECL
jgi:hypothetical protein